jgi:hypothetical protein
MQDLQNQREKLLINAADCELISNLAADADKRATFRRMAEKLRRMADEIGTAPGARQGMDAVRPSGSNVENARR